jgi:hypothetical protein
MHGRRETTLVSYTMLIFNQWPQVSAGTAASARVSVAAG